MKQKIGFLGKAAQYQIGMTDQGDLHLVVHSEPDADGRTRLLGLELSLELARGIAEDLKEAVAASTRQKAH